MPVAALQFLLTQHLPAGMDKGTGCKSRTVPAAVSAEPHVEKAKAGHWGAQERQPWEGSDGAAWGRMLLQMRKPEDLQGACRQRQTIAVCGRSRKMRAAAGGTPSRPICVWTIGPKRAEA